MKLQDQTNAFSAALETLKNFSWLYNNKIPEGLVSMSLYVVQEYRVDGPSTPLGKVHANISLSCQVDSERDRALTLLGDVFGRHGWTAKRNGSAYQPGYDWSKELQGVKITITSAKMLPKERDDIPVAPQEFPVLLHDAGESSAQESENIS